MKVFKESKTIKLYLQKLKFSQKSSNFTVGFVPTMGALHAGHISLIEASVKNCSITVCSIFVNPEQFNNKKDFELYPIDIANDLEILEKAGCDVVFVPNYEEIYGRNYLSKDYDIDGLDLILEGANRPGHFQGVCAVVHRLLEIVNPNDLFLGQKDFQQTVVLQRLVDKLNLGVKLTIMPIIREKNGLAMSSRNVRLSEYARENASFIYNSLLNVKHSIGNTNLQDVLKNEIEKINNIPNVEVEYLTVVDGNFLQSINNWDESERKVALIVVKYEGVRLLDNVLLD